MLSRALPLALLLSLPALAQDEAHQRAAEAYETADWPDSAAPRAGVNPFALRPEAWTRSHLDVDPRGRVDLGFHPSPSETSQPTAFVTLHLLPTPQLARDTLLAHLTTTTQRLPVVLDTGDLAFGARSPDLSLLDVAGTYGNVFFRVRSLDGAPIDDLLAAVDDLLFQAPPLEPGIPLPAPQVTLTTDTAQVGETPLEFASEGPRPRFMALDAGPTAAVVRTSRGWRLYASEPGTLTITGWVCSKDLAAAPFEATLTVE